MPISICRGVLIATCFLLAPKVAWCSRRVSLALASGTNDLKYSKNVTDEQRFRDAGKASTKEQRLSDHERARMLIKKWVHDGQYGKNTTSAKGRHSVRRASTNEHTARVRALLKKWTQHASDGPSPAYCMQHEQELEDSREEAADNLASEQAELEQLRAAEANCGCCCDDYHDIQTAIISAEGDVEYYSNRIDNLNEQIDALRAWCAR